MINIEALKVHMILKTAHALHGAVIIDRTPSALERLSHP